MTGTSELHFTNWTTSTPIRGGRHTVELRLDGTGVVTEHDETDNSYYNQFIWSPYLLSSDVAVVRDAPPAWSTMFPQPNADGFRYPKPSGYAYGVGIVSTTGEDVNIRGYNDYTGSEVGYDSVVVSSLYGSDIDFFVGTWTGVDLVIYPGVYTWYGSGTGDYAIHASNAQAGQFNPESTPYTVHDSLMANEILNTYEGYFIQDSSYTIILDNLSGTADLGLAIYGPDYGYYNRGQYAAWSNSVGPDEEITFVPTANSWHVIAVFKNDYTDVPIANVYDLTVMKTPPNLTTVVPTGWSYEFVPRNVGGAVPGNCHITATLPGNTTSTRLNFCGKNDSPIGIPNDPDFYNHLYLDGSYFFERPWAGSVPAGVTFYHINWTTTTPIRGGRHTIELRLDGTDIIYETNEADNDVERQFVWSPLSLANGVTVTRAVPPPQDYSFPQPNTDGFEYTRTAGVAYAVAICELEATDDFNLRVYNDYTGSESGFSSLVAGSYYLDGYTDYMVATYLGVSVQVFPGVYDYETTGIDAYVIEGVDASGGRLLNPGDTRRDTLVAYELIHVYEAYLEVGDEYNITVDNISGTADLALALYGPSNGYYSRGSYAAYSNNVGPDEEITYNPATTAWYVVTVFKPTTSELLPQNIYDLSITLPAPNLTYVDSPTGWDFPVVPRNAAGADTGNVVLTATLPGNTSNTYFNYHTYNEGPSTVSDTYWNYIFIDSTSWYGSSMFTTQPALTYDWYINRQSSNMIRGGRHTVGVSIDRWDDIAENDETDNWYEQQFVWSPYVLTNYTPVSHNSPPPWGNGTYMNCDGFEFTTSWWGAVGIIPHNVNSDHNLRLHDPWVNSQTGFDFALDGSGWGIGQSDFIIASDLVAGGKTLDIGVVRDLTNPSLGDFHIEQANQQVTWVTPGTYGPYTLGSFDVLGVWEVYVSPGSQIDFEVDVISGSADIGTSIYGTGDTYYDKSEYISGGFSNSAGPGGDESFTVPDPGAYYYYGWVVWKEGTADLTLSSTFYLTWGFAGAPVPMPVDDLVIQRIDSTGARLIWSQVTQDTSGNPLAVDYYRIHRNLDPGFTPSTVDSIGYTTAPDTTYDDINVVWSYDKYFYKVIAVDTDGVVASQPGEEERGRIITGDPLREEAPEAIRSRQRR